MSVKEQNELSNRLKHKSMDEAESLLVGKVREISQRNHMVGPHCVSILLPPPSNPNISVRYYAADPDTISDSQKLADDQLVWAYSPWIVSPNVCQPPGEISGGFTLRTGPFTIHFIWLSGGCEDFFLRCVPLQDETNRDRR